MAKDIEFLDQPPRYVDDRECLSFPVRVDGQPVECQMTAKLLETQFGAQDYSEEEMRRAFRDHLPEIQSLARMHIENGWVNSQNQMLLTARCTRLTVTYGKGLELYPPGRELVATAHGALLGIVGPNARAVEVLWDVDVDGPSHPAITVRITDPEVGNSVFGTILAKNAADPSVLGVHLGLTWGSVLRNRSQKQIARFG